MTFCSSCGAQLEGDGKFCVKCGADQTAKAGSAPAPAPVGVAAPPQAVYPPQPPAVQRPPVQPYAGTPPQFSPPPQFPPPGQPFAGVPPQFPPQPGQYPVIMGAPPVAPAGNKNTLMYLVLGAAALYGLYYIGTHDQAQNPPPAPQTQPGQQQPGGGGGGNQNQALVAQQQFNEGAYNAVNGQIQVTQGQWINGSTVALAAAMLGCEQMDANGQNLAQDQVTLTGPAAPGATVNLATFSIGAEAQGAAKVNCKITDVQTAN
jgi:hypothetical protein